MDTPPASFSKVFRPFDPDVTMSAHDSLPAAVDPRAASTTSERYEVKSVLGRGGMGEVRLCRDLRIGREVAIKLAHRDSGRARFLREARVQAQLDHPAIVPVHEIEIFEDGSAYFSMKRVRGKTLAEILRERRSGVFDANHSQRKLLTAMLNVCLAVDFAHKKGVIHRDIKPQNIMLGDFGEVYVLDWGLAKIVGVEDFAEQSDEIASPSLTEAGSVLGTLGYMAPEQLDGALGEVGPRSDIFALGAVLYEIACNAPFIEAGDRLDAVMKTLQSADPHPSKRDPNVSPMLDAMCARALARDPLRRYASARDLHDALDAFLAGEQDQSVRRKLAKGHLTSVDVNVDAPEARARALKELGSALAIDPDNHDARRALVTLLTKAPSTMPPAAQDRLDDAERRERREFALFTAFGQTANFLLAPFLFALGVLDPVTLAVALGLFAAAAFMNLVVWRNGSAALGYLAIAVALCGYVALSRIGGPFIIVCSMLVGFATASQVHPLAAHRRLALLGSAVAIIVAFVLPQLGVWGQSYSDIDAGIAVNEQLLKLDMPALWFFCIVEVSAVVTPALFAARLRSARAQAERKLVAQAWQLEQLVPH